MTTETLRSFRRCTPEFQFLLPGGKLEAAEQNTTNDRKQANVIQRYCIVYRYL